jgi:NAD-dependent SIR2 family protein deacetylase
MVGRRAEFEYFRCNTCHQPAAVDFTAAPGTISRCPQCGKIFGRVDAVCTAVVDATNTLAAEMLRHTFDKLMDADKKSE